MRTIDIEIGKYLSERLSREETYPNYDDQNYQYSLITQGNPKAVEVACEKFLAGSIGELPSNPLQNAKFHFVWCAAYICHASVKGGLNFNNAYIMSDVYIQKVELCKSVEEVKTLFKDMCEHFVNEVIASKKRIILSKPITMCVDYINSNLNTKITANTLAQYVNLNQSYLSTLFHKSVGKSITEFINERKMQVAIYLLVYTSCAINEISDSLAFPNCSHFGYVFKNFTGLTPSEYRNQHSL